MCLVGATIRFVAQLADLVCSDSTEGIKFDDMTREEGKGVREWKKEKTMKHALLIHLRLFES